jgi:hypothetical protein
MGYEVVNLMHMAQDRVEFMIMVMNMQDSKQEVW